ncbi:hypothetical protein D6789_00350 [Candidatus Woesearchaeota archaeon]|nr:MAG: hypothetical protein D6789_00350 [Candidatus Woesearchaeota archaeon]
MRPLVPTGVVIAATLVALVILTFSFSVVSNLLGNAGSGTVAEQFFTRDTLLHLLGAVTVVSILVAVGSLYLSQKRHHELVMAGIAQEGAEEESEKIFKRGELVEVEDPTTDPVGKLWDYVDNELRQGYTRDAIIAQLRKQGWPEQIITTVTDTFRDAVLEREGMQPHDDIERLKEWIQEKRRYGYPLGVIRTNLVRAGWQAKIVDEAIKGLATQRLGVPVAQLHEFVGKRLEEGLRKPEIRDLLLKRGWKASTIDAELAQW